MKAKDFFEDSEHFHTEDDIRQAIAEANEYNENEESVADAVLKLFFKTSRQRTWLVLTEKRLYSILDDIEKGIRILWVKNITDFIVDNVVKTAFKVEDTSNEYGTINLEDAGKKLLYSKKLMKKGDPNASISDFISQKLK